MCWTFYKLSYSCLDHVFTPLGPLSPAGTRDGRKTEDGQKVTLKRNHCGEEYWSILGVIGLLSILIWINVHYNRNDFICLEFRNFTMCEQ